MTRGRRLLALADMHGGSALPYIMDSGPLLRSDVHRLEAANLSQGISGRAKRGEDIK